MSWPLVLAPLMIAVTSAKTTAELPSDVLNNLAALDSAENILEHIDELTNTSRLDSTTTTTTTKKHMQISLQNLDVLLKSGRRMAAPPIDSRYNDFKGLQALYEMKRRLQQGHQNNLTPVKLSMPDTRRNQYKDSDQPVFPYYGLPSQVASDPEQQTAAPVYETQTPDPRLLSLTQYAQLAKLGAPAYQELPPARPVRPPQPSPRALSSLIPEWMLRYMADRRARTPMDSHSLAPLLPGQPLNSQFSSFSSTEYTSEDPQKVLEAALLEVQAKISAKSKSLEDRSPQIRMPMPPQRPMLRVSMPTLTTTSHLENTRLQRNMPNANALLRAYPHMNATRWSQDAQASSVPKRFKLLTVNSNNEKLEKLMSFMKQNRDALLQFIAMKRQQLVADADEAAKDEQGAAPSETNDMRNSNQGRYPPIAEALISNDKGAGNSLNPSKELGKDIGKEAVDLKDVLRVQTVPPKGITLRRPIAALSRMPYPAAPAPNPAAYPVQRAVPSDYPEQLFDLAPAKGDHIDKMRYKDRLCQRNIMQVSGPKYDHQARVRMREFRPGVDGRAFRVTRRKRLLLPACCNCCKKSVLGCQ